MKLTTKELRRCIRMGIPGWRRIRTRDKGPCGAVAQAQIVCGYGSTLHWCETRDAADRDQLWYSHWTVKHAGKIVDVSGCFLDGDNIDARYRKMTRRRFIWPNDYTLQEVEYWVNRIERWEKRRG